MGAQFRRGSNLFTKRIVDINLHVYNIAYKETRKFGHFYIDHGEVLADRILSCQA